MFASSVSRRSSSDHLSKASTISRKLFGKSSSLARIAFLTNGEKLDQPQPAVAKTEEVPKIQVDNFCWIRCYSPKRSMRSSRNQPSGKRPRNQPSGKRPRNQPSDKSPTTEPQSVKSNPTPAVPEAQNSDNVTNHIISALHAYLCLNARGNQNAQQSNRRRTPIHETNYEKSNLRAYMGTLNLTKVGYVKSTGEDRYGFKFITPKLYDCEYCVDRKFFDHQHYFMHLRTHKLQDITRCRGCNKKFDLETKNINDIRRHELTCKPRVPTM